MPRDSIERYERLPLARVFLRARLAGGWGASYLRHKAAGRLELRARFDGVAIVTVWRGRGGLLLPERYEGRAFDHLLSRCAGEDLRIVVEGAAAGVAELVEV